MKENAKNGNKSILVVDLGEAQLSKKFDTLSRRAYTPAYVSPERLEGKEASLASDMW